MNDLIDDIAVELQTNSHDYGETISDIIEALFKIHPEIKSIIDGESVAIPIEPDEVLVYKAREAFRKMRRGEISGMSLDAQFRSEFAPELAFYETIVRGL